jgi:hypothetical protein
MYDRSKTIGASDAVYIAEGRWAELFDIKKDLSLDRLSDVLPVQIGKVTQDLNLDWFQRDWSTQLIRYGDEDSPERNRSLDWMVCLPDAVLPHKIGHAEYNIPVEAKHVNQFWNPRNLIAKYTPQLLHQMVVLEAPYAYLSVIYGNGSKYEYYLIDYDDIAASELLKQEELFHWFLENNQRPPE